MVYDRHTMSSVTSLVIAHRERRKRLFNSTVRRFIWKGARPLDAVHMARITMAAPRERTFCVILPFRGPT